MPPLSFFVRFSAIVVALVVLVPFIDTFQIHFPRPTLFLTSYHHHHIHNPSDFKIAGKNQGNDYGMPIISEAQLKNGQFAADYEWTNGYEVPAASKKTEPKKAAAAAAPEKKGLASFFGKKPLGKK